MSGIVKVVGGGVGLAREYHAYRKAAKSAQALEAELHAEGSPSELEGRDMNMMQEVPCPLATHGFAPAREDGPNGDGPLAPSLQQLPTPPPYDSRGRLPLP